MAKSLKILSYLFFISFSLSFASGSRYKWDKITLPIRGPFSFAGGTASKFWVHNTLGDLLKVENGKPVERFKSPFYPLKKSFYMVLNEQRFFLAATTKEWKGIIFEHKNGKWQKLTEPLSVPLNGLIELRKKIYAYGDFGLVLEVNNSKCKVLDTPFESHSLFALNIGSKIIFSTRSDGIFSFDGKEFEKIKTPEDFTFATEAKEINEKIYLHAIDGRLYVLDKNRIKEINDEKINRVFAQNISEKFGFDTRLLPSKNNMLKITFPRYFNVDKAVLLENDFVLLFSSEKTVYAGSPTSEMFFVDLANYYELSSLPGAHNVYSQLCDFNNDGICDLLKINANFGNYVTMYRGVKNSSFANITSITGLPYDKYPVKSAAISDVNDDGYPDVILQVKKESSTVIQVFENQGNLSFEQSGEYDLVKDFRLIGARYLTTFDFDEDGDEDIIVVSYYGAKNNPGYVSIHKNNYWGDFSEVDTSLASITRRWNRKIVFADLNNDNAVDFYSATFWGKDRIFINRNNEYFDETDIRLPFQTNKETYEALMTDYDRDGDLDIFVIRDNDFIRVYRNNGKGYFHEVAEKLFDESFFGKSSVHLSNLRFADFNNDTFTDLIVTSSILGSAETLFFLNNGGKFFEEKKFGYEKENETFYNSTIADIDNDGDLDIYGTDKKRNVLLINLLNSNNALKIKLEPVISSSDAKGTKIWVFGSDSARTLLGYKEIGTENFTENSANDFTIHFGLGAVQRCNVKVRFLSGKEVIVKNVKAGSFITVRELPLFAAFFYRLPGNIYRLLEKPKNQLYVLLIVLSHSVIFLGLWLGFVKLGWTNKLTYFIALTNISLFWITLYTASFSAFETTKYFAPFSLALFLTFIPVLISYLVNKSTRKNTNEQKEKLLKLIMDFSHGEWALRNLNSIILLCENAPENWKENEEYREKLISRFETFIDMTAVSIEEIIELEKLSGKNKKEVAGIEKSLRSIRQKLENRDELDCPRKFIDDFTNIRESIKTLRYSVYSDFSCNPIEVIKRVAENYEQILKNEEIELVKVKKFRHNVPVLIKGFELANIIDNLFQNSVYFVKNSPRKKIEIELLKESPKIVILFSNTGEPVSEEIREKIFEHGFSKSGGTGQGLYQSRTILNKYGGRIFVARSDGTKTVFKIELNEGKSKIIES